MKITFLSILFLLVFGNCHSIAQEKVTNSNKNTSYIILSYGDTLYGKVTTSVSGHVKFKDLHGSETMKYGPTELIGYYAGKNKKTYITINPDDDNHGPWLYEQKANGTITMYSYVFEGANSGRMPYYYVEKGNSGLERILKGSVVSIKKEKDVLRDFMNDNPDMLNELKRTGWSEKKLLKLITKYNEWYVRTYPVL
jgi:hypothetical protein